MNKGMSIEIVIDSWVNDMHFFFFCILGLQLLAKEVLKLAVELELQLSSRDTAIVTDMWDLSLFVDLHYSSW